MSSPRLQYRGFTLIELVVTLAVMAVLLGLAVPSFIALRQRNTLAGTGEQVLGFWNQARLEAAKRNQMVKVGVFVDGGGDFCLGANTTDDRLDDDPCDCLTAGSCNVAAFPASQADWHGLTLEGTPTLGQDTGVAVIDPKRTLLTEADDDGAISFNGPPGQYSYRLNFLADRFGRGVLCESTSATHQMPAYTTRRCGP